MKMIIGLLVGLSFGGVFGYILCAVLCIDKIGANYPKCGAKIDKENTEKFYESH